MAEEIISGLSDEVRSRKLKLVTIYDPENEAAKKYTEIKERKAKELNIDFEKFSITNFQFSINDQITKFNNDKNIDGVMIQIPLTGDRDRDLRLCGLISPEKDVDGLNPESGVVPATVRAVLEILKVAGTPLVFPPKIGGKEKGGIVVVGNKGTVGSKLAEYLKCEGMDKEDFDPTSLKLRGASVVISCTGVPGLIKPKMVKDGVICIDVGFPKGDFDPSTALRASFFTPVPGGVGPVTVAMLFRNLVDLVKIKI